MRANQVTPTKQKDIMIMIRLSGGRRIGSNSSQFKKSKEKREEAKSHLLSDSPEPTSPVSFWVGAMQYQNDKKMIKVGVAKKIQHLILLFFQSTFEFN